MKHTKNNDAVLPTAYITTVAKRYYTYLLDCHWSTRMGNDMHLRQVALLRLMLADHHIRLAQ